jgi:8-oxo-dGTP pyrophosphatase MutT (NUDIX family)
MKKGKILSSETALDVKWFKVQKDVVEFPNGVVVDDYYVWKNFEIVSVVAITPDNKLVLVKQYKHGGGDIFIEVPAGFVEEGEKPEDTALRELTEETGYRGDKLELIGKLANNPTKETGNICVYLARNSRKVGKINPDEHEQIEVLEVSFKEALDMIYTGKIRIAGTISAIFLALKKLGYEYEL